MNRHPLPGSGPGVSTMEGPMPYYLCAPQHLEVDDLLDPFTAGQRMVEADGALRAAQRFVHQEADVRGAVPTPTYPVTVVPFSTAGRELDVRHYDVPTVGLGR